MDLRSWPFLSWLASQSCSMEGHQDEMRRRLKARERNEMLREAGKIAIGSALAVLLISLTGCATENQTSAARPPVYSEAFKMQLADEIVEKDIQDGSAIGEALKDLCTWAKC